MQQRTGVGGRLALVGIAVVGLLAVVALASRGRLGGGSGGAPAAPSASVLSWAFSIFLVLLALGIPVAVWAWIVQQREQALRPRPGRRNWLSNLIVFAAFFALSVALVSLRHARGARPALHLPTTAGVRGALRSRRPGEAPPQPSFRWPVLLGFGALALAAGGAYALRRREEPRRPPPVAQELTAALDDAIDDVRAERDPRRAVIRAYARTEAVLGAHGLPRRPAEAPYEYLARALEELVSSEAPLRRLTGLYERARFSLHEIDAAMRTEAVEALTAVRDELRAAAA